jgi:hypothetical protein
MREDCMSCRVNIVKILVGTKVFVLARFKKIFIMVSNIYNYIAADDKTISLKVTQNQIMPIAK